MDASCRAAIFACALSILLPISSHADCKDYARALTLARDGDLHQAAMLLEACAAADPFDKRYPIELAGIAYLQKDYPDARRYLRRALRLDPSDAYVNDFLGTLYYLGGNQPAALKYWNRVDKPRIGLVDTNGANIRADLLDHMIHFAPGSVLKLDEYLTTQAQLQPFGAGERLWFSARSDEDYEVTIASSRDGRWARVARLFEGVSTQSLTPQLTNIGGRGVTWDGLIRWDAQKRRLSSAISWPAAASPKHWFTLGADYRRETWNTGDATDFRLNLLELRASLGSIESGRFRWQSGLAATRRQFGDAPGLEGGWTLGYLGKIQRVFLDQPERRFRILGNGLVEVGTWFAEEPNTYSRLRADLILEWTPQPDDSRYLMRWRMSSGKIFGQVPFDELFMLGMGVDSDLWLRGHSATWHGRKGNALLGRSYVLQNLELDRRLLRRSFFTVSAGPFFDLGRVPDPLGRDRTQLWQLDVGLQAKVGFFGIAQVIVSYGRDLRGGGGLFAVNSGFPFSFFSSP